jgi:hypothetical protein
MKANAIAWNLDGKKIGVVLENGDLVVLGRTGEELKRLDADLGEFGSVAWSESGQDI